MDSIDVGRRRFVARTLAGALALSTVGALAACRPAGRDDRRVIEALRVLLGGAGTVPQLSPEASSIATSRVALDTLWAGASPPEIEALLESPGALRAFLQERRLADFGAERVATLDGWILAESELALVVLLAQPPAGEH
jgi:hypothetical protein